MDQLITCPLCDGHGALPNAAPRPCDRCRGRGTISTSFTPHSKPELGHMPWETRCPDCGGAGTQPTPAVTVCAMCSGQGTLPRAAVTVTSINPSRNR